MCVGTGQVSSSEGQSSITMGKPTEESSLLLELAAHDDLLNFKLAVESGKEAVDSVSWWYCKHHHNGSTRMALQQRTPAMVAALYGSYGVLDYILKCYLSKVGCPDINRRYGSDSTTALHCAASGSSKKAVEVTKLLLGFGADASVVDAYGRRPVDVVAVPAMAGQARAELEQLLAESDCDAKSSTTTASSSSSLSSPSSPRMAKEKPRDYPVDPSLPDIKSGVYGTDEFRMFSFKIRPCSRAYSHDWTECPFAHPGENARRRDPRKHNYGCAPCPEFRKGGSCKRGDACEYAHGVFECWLHPAQYRTRLCKDGVECSRRVCFFAHVAEELRLCNSANNSATPPFSPSSPSSPSMFAMSPKTSTPPISPQQGLVCVPQLSMPTLRLPGAIPQSASRLRATLSARDMPTGANITMLRNPGLSIVPTNLDDLFAYEMSVPSPRSPSLLLNTQFLNQHSSPRYNNNNNNKHTAVQLSPRKPQELAQPYGFFAHPNMHNPSPLSDWGSPTGKLEWGTSNGHSFRGFQKKPVDSSLVFKTVSDSDPGPEPDLSWVQTLVKDNSPINQDAATTTISASSVSTAAAAVVEQSVVGSWIEQIHFDPQIVA